MKTIQNLENGNRRTQVTCFIGIAVILIIAAVILNIFHLINVK